LVLPLRVMRQQKHVENYITRSLICTLPLALLGRLWEQEVHLSFDCNIFTETDRLRCRLEDNIKIMLSYDEVMMRYIRLRS
jgi:hypothetical protein